MISAPLAAALAARRSDLNARFRLAAQRYPQLDGAELLRFIGECVDPLIIAVQQHGATAIDAVVSAAYDCALQLVGQRLTLESGRYRSIPTLWRELLPVAAVHVAETPTRVLAALSNASHQLAGVAEQAAAQWQQRMLANIPNCASAQECLQAGQVNAWLCGLAHYREGALSALRALPPQLAANIVGVNAARWSSSLESLHADPWFDPAHPTRNAMRVVRHAGGFRGFGGMFLQPPLVKSAPGGWLVQSAEDHWLLIADAFGATLHRVAAADWKATQNLPAQHHGTQLSVAGKMLEMVDAGPISSSALSAGPATQPLAAACTFVHSHQIALIALGR